MALPYFSSNRRATRDQAVLDAAVRDDLEALRAALAAGGAANGPRNVAHSPLIAAIRHHNVPAVELLRKHGAHLGAKRYLPEENRRQLRSWLPYPLDMPWHRRASQTPLEAAAAANAPGAIVRAVTGSDAVPRHALEAALLVFSAHGNAAAVEELHNDGARLDHAREHDGATALHLACQGDHVGVADALLARGANPGVRTYAGLRPFDVATHSAAFRCMRRLLIHCHYDALTATEALEEMLRHQAHASPGDLERLTREAYARQEATPAEPGEPCAARLRRACEAVWAERQARALALIRCIDLLGAHGADFTSSGPDLIDFATHTAASVVAALLDRGARPRTAPQGCAPLPALTRRVRTLVRASDQPSGTLAPLARAVVGNLDDLIAVLIAHPKVDPGGVDSDGFTARSIVASLPRSLPRANRALRARIDRDVAPARREA